MAGMCMDVEKRLSVVFVADVPQEGGASASLSDVVKTLVQEYDVSCTVLLPTTGPLVDKLNAAGAQTVVTGHRSFLVARPSSWWKVAPKYIIELVRYLANRGRAVRIANRSVDFSSVDVIHSNLPRNDIGIMLSTLHNIPHVCHLREYSFDDFGCWSYRRWPAKYISDNSSRLLAVSSACGAAWIRRGMDPNKLRIVYNGVHIDKFRRENVGMSVSKSPLSLVFLGGYGKAKGVSDAIGTIKVLKDRGIEGVTLDVFGGGSGLAVTRARNLVKKYGIGDQVSLHGMVQDVADVLSEYDVGLVCSRCEAFGRVVIEYMASGLAVIGSNSGSLPELLGDGEYGLLYEKRLGAKALADSLEELLNDRGLLESLRKKASTRAKEFTVERNVAEIMDVYRDILCE